MKKNIFIVKIFIAVWICQLASATPSFAKILEFKITRTVQEFDGNRLITTRLNLRRTQTNEIMRNVNDLKYLVQNMMERAKMYMENFKMQTYNKTSQQSRQSDMARDSRDKTQRLIQAQKMMRDAQQDRLAAARETARQLIAKRRDMMGR